MSTHNIHFHDKIRIFPLIFVFLHYQMNSLGLKTEFKSSTVSEPSMFQGPVVQRVVSLTSSLRVISLTVLANSIYNILIIFAEKM